MKPTQDGVLDLLIIDDEIDFCKSLKTRLEHTGKYQVSYTTDPSTAEDHPAFEPSDVILIDLRMPHKTGEELVIELDEQRPLAKKKFVVISGIARCETILPTSPPVTVLPKPVDLQRLQEVIDNLALTERN